jgi:hypothetical protein
VQPILYSSQEFISSFYPFHVGVFSDVLVSYALDPQRVCVSSQFYLVFLQHVICDSSVFINGQFPQTSLKGCPITIVVRFSPLKNFNTNNYIINRSISSAGLAEHLVYLLLFPLESHHAGLLFYFYCVSL